MNTTATGSAGIQTIRRTCEVEPVTTTATRETPPARAPLYRAPKTWALSLASLAVLAMAGWGAARWWSYSRSWVKTDNAYVAGHVHQVSSRVAGTAIEVLVSENQEVAAGTLLARLDPRDFEVRRDQAGAEIAQARAQGMQAESQLAQNRAQVSREQARARKASQDLERAQNLVEGNNGAISRQEFDQARAEADAARASLEGAEAALQSAVALVSAATAKLQLAEAALREIDLQISYTRITAPVEGRIGRKNLEVGNRVQPGQALLALVQPRPWVVANFKETQLARMQPGQLAEIRLDAFPGRSFRGRVDSIAPATGSQFALLPPDNATGNFTRIVQRVPVKVVFETESVADCANRIAPGMSGIVEVRVGAG